MKEAYFTLSRSTIKKQYEKLVPIAHKISYSSKTNQEVTTVLEKESNCFFSVHLEQELKHIKDLSRAIFLAQGWDEEQIKKLLAKGINWFVVDNETDLNTLLEFLSKSPQDINLFLRLKLKENTIKTEKYYVFGMPSHVINKYLPIIREKHPCVKQLGVHFHRKTQNMSEWKLTYEIDQIIDEHNWKHIDILNIGGGLPSAYANTNMDVLDGIFCKIKEFKTYLEGKKTELMLEPGRFIAAPAGKLHTTITSIHDNTIIVNASVYNGDSDALIVPVKLLIDQEKSKEDGEPYLVKGMTPCSLDIFRYKVYLSNPKKGDEIIFINAGAYNFSSDFCDMEKLETKIID